MTDVEKAIDLIECFFRESDNECKNLNCENQSPSCKFEREAAMEFMITALRSQAEREANEPLTLDELKQMDGEPIWFETGEISIDEQILGRWAIITERTNKAIWITCTKGNRYGNAWLFENYGKTWFAYRYKKENT